MQSKILPCLGLLPQKPWWIIHKCLLKKKCLLPSGFKLPIRNWRHSALGAFAKEQKKPLSFAVTTRHLWRVRGSAVLAVFFNSINTIWKPSILYKKAIIQALKSRSSWNCGRQSKEEGCRFYWTQLLEWLTLVSRVFNLCFVPLRIAGTMWDFSF